MKRLILTALLLVARNSFASDVMPGNSARPVTIDEIETELVGNDQLKTEVKVLATFSNACRVPLAEELFLIAQNGENSTLELALGSLSHRHCLQNYEPVTVTLDLGSFANYNRPDGRFGVVVVNGKSITIAF